MKEEIYGGYRNLAAAIIKQAAIDDYNARVHKDECLKWFEKTGRIYENRHLYKWFSNHLKREISRTTTLLQTAALTQDAYKSLCFIRDYIDGDVEKLKERQKTFAKASSKCQLLQDANIKIDESKRFFYSQWFIQLSDADGPSIYNQLKENYKLGRRPKNSE